MCVSFDRDHPVKLLGIEAGRIEEGVRVAVAANRVAEVEPLVRVGQRRPLHLVQLVMTTHISLAFP